MSGFPILDVAIGLSFIYLLLALVCSTVMEWIAQVRNMRGELLEQSIRRLLSEPPGGGSVANAVLNHPLIRTMKDGTRKPSYISGTVFAKALRDVLAGGPGTAAVAQTASPELQRSFKALGATRGAAPTEESLANWYDAVMDRVSGTYRRQTRTPILVLAIAVTLLLNADSISLTTHLWENPTLRAYVLERAKVRLEQGPPLETVEYTDPTSPVPTAPIDTAAATSASRLLPEEQDLLGSLFGWSLERSSLEDARTRWGGPFWGTVVWSLRHLLGWAITALAVSLGAPFWFDMLKKFVNPPSTGPEPKPAAANP